MEQVSEETKKPSFFRSHKVLYPVFLLLLLGIWGYRAMSAPDITQGRANREPTIVHIDQGESLDSVARDLEAKNIVRHAVLLKAFTKILRMDRQVDRGDYRFDYTMPVWRVAWMLASGEHRIDPVKITFKEGITNEEMADILAQKTSAFRRDLFLSDSRAKQGYLFPDTYFFFPFTTSYEMISDLTANFSTRIKTLTEDISKSGHSLEDIIIMASILEKEAKGKNDIDLISGILWKRLEKGMPLQVDAAPETYKKTGLPTAPIANPGLSSIQAAINPSESPYLFYLHGKDGTVHFAKTYGEHKRNIDTYLR